MSDTLNVINMLRDLANGLASGSFALDRWNVTVDMPEFIQDYTASHYMPVTRPATLKTLSIEISAKDRFEYTDRNGVRRVVE